MRARAGTEPALPRRALGAPREPIVAGQTLKLWRNARLATCDAGARVITRGALLTRGGRIEWVGPEDELPATAAPAEVHDLNGAWVTPGLIDCHTHLVFAGTRADEYAERLRGHSYEDIARAGGGILSSVRARARRERGSSCSTESAPRLAALASEGVTTLEIKSGYGLTLADEAKMLRVARAPRACLPGHGAHHAARRAHPAAGVPRARRRVHRRHRAASGCRHLLAEGLVDAVDVFCERIAFTRRAGRAAVRRGARALGCR